MIKIDKNLLLFYLTFFVVFFTVGFVFDTADSTLLSSVEIPTELTISSLEDAYFIDAGFSERLSNLFTSMTEITTWHMIFSAWFGAYAILWFFGKASHSDAVILGSAACILMFLTYIIGINIFEFNIWFKSSSIMVAMLNFIAIGKVAGLAYLKYKK